MLENGEQQEDVEDRLARHEAIILRRDRYSSDAQFKRDVGWWMVYTRDGCEKLRQLLYNPDYTDQREQIQDLLARRTARLNHLECILNEREVDRE